MNSPSARRLASIAYLVVFRITLIAVGFSTVKALTFALQSKSRFLESFPGASEFLYAVFLAAAVIGFVILLGLFHFQRWALWLFILLAGVVNVLNLLVAAPSLHSLSTIALTGLILGLTYLLRDRFSRLRSA